MIRQRKIMTNPRFLLLIGAVIFGTAATGLPAEPDAAAVSSFRSYLRANRLDARWQADDPLRRLDSTELRTAYGDREFYFTFKGAPLPPGAPVPEVIAIHNRALDEYKKHSLRLTVGIDKARKVNRYEKAEDFNAGLMPVKSDSDTKIAAAAILSLIGNEQVHPAVIAANEVTVTATEAGWTCRVSQKRGVDGTVVFDPSGKCVSAKKALNYIPPMPP